MLRFSFLLLVVASSLATPTDDYDNIIVDLDSDIGVAKNIGCANHLTDGLFNLLDGGDVTIHTITLNQIDNDLAAKKGREAQALALSHAIVTTIVQATGIPGDACISADLIKAYTSGDDYRPALINYIKHIATNLYLLVNLRRYPQQARFQVGPRSGCIGGGRIYDFEAAWEKIIENAPPSAAGLINEQYCTAKRLYNAFSVKSNNIAAVVTATSLPPVAKIFYQVYKQLYNLVSAILSNNNVFVALSAAVQALINALRGLNHPAV